jgi:hypothetical protein
LDFAFAMTDPPANGRSTEVVPILLSVAENTKARVDCPGSPDGAGSYNNSLMSFDSQNR